jgi:hypothetical protein
MVRSVAFYAAKTFHATKGVMRSWIWFGVAMLCWFIGDVIYSYYEIVLAEPPFPFFGRHLLHRLLSGFRGWVPPDPETAPVRTRPSESNDRDVDCVRSGNARVGSP